MPRKARDFYLSNFYHIMVQGDEKKFIFNNNIYKNKYIYLLRHNAFRNDVEVISYCIMDNHAHILVFCPEIERISKMMLQINTSFGLYYNKSLQKIGHVFRERFKTESIYTKCHLINCIRYILNNPVKANMCLKPQYYHFSNYNEVKNMKNNMLEICDFSIDELNNILDITEIDMNFIDDNSFKENELDVLKEIMNRKELEGLNDISICQIYREIKERCGTIDCKIAELIGIQRNKLIRILKRNGIKK